MTRVLITGASGYIGSAVALHLAAQGLRVYAGMRARHLQSGISLPGCELLECDVLSPPAALPECDAVIHCATANDILSRDFRAGVDLSVNGTRTMLELARKAGVQRVIFLSTVQVYGTELQGLITEETPTACETPYALNHLLGEEVCRMAARTWPGVRMALLRPSNVYGVPALPSVDRATLVPMCFVRQALAEGRLALRSSGLQQRNFISTREVAQTCAHLLQHMPTGVQPVLAASGWQATIREIALLTADVHAQVTGRELPVDFQSPEPATGNDFTLRPIHAPLGLSPEAARAEMTATLLSLFPHFQTHP